ncbi:hypothetical protein ACQPZZ_10465 [Microbispora sp. CA-135349]|uniref:hypothetical protein n=1 Tax=Microbispora sp. CA-135349 TaxID=3239953 RepID=UPI003D8B05B0
MPFKKDPRVDLLAEGQRYAAVRERVIQNMPWIVTGAIFFLILIRILLVSRLDVPTALAVLQQTGPIELAPAILLSLLPTLSVGLGVVGYRIAFIHEQHEYLRYQRFLHWTFYGAAVIAFAAIQNWSTTLLQAAIPPLTYLGYKLSEWKNSRKKAKRAGMSNREGSGRTDKGATKSVGSDNVYPETGDSVIRQHYKRLEELDSRIAAASSGPVELDKLKALRDERRNVIGDIRDRAGIISESWKSSTDLVIGGLIIYLLLNNFVTFFSEAPWLPSEKIRIDRVGVVPGYILKTDETWTTILTLGRSLRTVKTDSVVSRELCRIGRVSPSGSVRTIFGQLNNSPNYPPCVVPAKPRSDPSSRPSPQLGK